MSLKVKHTDPKENTVQQFQKRYPTMIGKKRALNKMTNAQIDELIEDCGTAQGRIFYKSFKK